MQVWWGERMGRVVWALGMALRKRAWGTEMKQWEWHWGWADIAKRQWNLRVGTRELLAICCVTLSELLSLSELLFHHHGDNKTNHTGLL